MLSRSWIASKKRWRSRGKGPVLLSIGRGIFSWWAKEGAARLKNPFPCKIALLGILLSLQFSTISFANAYNTTDINVSIESIAEITLSPTFITWNDLEPGSVGGTKTIEISNTGSINVTDIYAYLNTLTVESTRPYGTDSASSYASGDVVVMRNQTSTDLAWVGRLEWNWTNTISNLVTTNVDNPVAWGFFKNVSTEYVWLVGNGTGGYCNDTGTQFAIDDDIDVGTASTRTPETTDFTTPDAVGVDWAVFSIDRADSPLFGRCVATFVNCTKIYIYKYDRSNSVFNQCLNARNIRDVIVPSGDSETLTLDVYIPEGIPGGNMSTTVLTVYGSS